MAFRNVQLIAVAAVSLVAVVGPIRAGSLIDLANTPADLSILGEAAVDNLGSWLSTGDINGDGVEDLVAVACNSHPLEGTRTGTLYILWGDQLSGQSVVDLPATTTGVSRVFGNPGDDDLYCTVTCGDFNHDGFDDIVWGSPAAGFDWNGKVYIIFGMSAFPDTLDLYLQPSGVTTVYGDVASGFLGRGLCACDVDGDDYDDLLISAPWLEYSEVFVVFGRDIFPPTLHTQPAGPGMVRIVDNEANRATGKAIACRDVNEDGYDDLLLGAPGLGAPTADGRVILLYGSPSLPDTVLLANPPVPVKRLLGEYSHGGLGVSVAIADLNRDARQDVVAGAWGADPLGCYDCGEVYVLYDANSLPDTVDLATTSVPMTRVIGSGQSTKNGLNVLCSDLSGDLIDDLVVTNWPLDVRATTTVIYGRELMPATVLLATESGPITRIKEHTKGDILGYGLTAIDVDSDSVNDLVLGAPYASPPDRGSAGIVYGFLSSRLVTPVGGSPVPRLTLDNFPNPFSAQTTIVFHAVERGVVEVSIFDVTGRVVLRRTARSHRGGALEVVWDGRDERGYAVPGGVYFCRARVNGVTATRKLVLIR